VRVAYAWVHRAAHLLENTEQRKVEELRREYRSLLGEMLQGRAKLTSLAPAVDHFLKVTKSYWLGLFRCYGVSGLPKTNNELEQFFGSARYHERRATGRKGAASGLVLRGAARILASVATRNHRYEAAELRPHDLAKWRELRTELDQRHEARRQQFRFRRDPDRYLAELERLLLHPGLPP
jgi:hypothetical protein